MLSTSGMEIPWNSYRFSVFLHVSPSHSQTYRMMWLNSGVLPEFSMVFVGGNSGRCFCCREVASGHVIQVWLMPPSLLDTSYQYRKQLKSM
jgi:hypothetical protein